MATRRSWLAEFAVDAEMSVIFGDCCEKAGRYIEVIGGDAAPLPDDAGLGSMIEAHGKICAPDSADAGAFRTKDARVTRDGRVAFSPPQPATAERLTKELFEWARETSWHPLISSAIFHYYLLSFHPFSDGNGRIAREWHSLILGKWRRALRGLDIEGAIAPRKKDYILALEKSDRERTPAPFVTFMLGIVSSAMDNMRESAPVKTPDKTNETASREGDSPAGPVSPRMPYFIEKLLSTFEGGAVLSASEIMKKLALSHRGTFRQNYLEPAIKSGCVEPTQPNAPKSPTQKYRLTTAGEEAVRKN